VACAPARARGAALSCCGGSGGGGGACGACGACGAAAAPHAAADAPQQRRRGAALHRAAPACSGAGGGCSAAMPPAAAQLACGGEGLGCVHFFCLIARAVRARSLVSHPSLTNPKIKLARPPACLAACCTARRAPMQHAACRARAGAAPPRRAASASASASACACDAPPLPRRAPRAAAASAPRRVARAAAPRRRRAPRDGACVVRAGSGGSGSGGKGSPIDDVLSKLRAAAPLVDGAASFVPVRRT
jgi:hypothetical protein